MYPWPVPAAAWRQARKAGERGVTEAPRGQAPSPDADLSQRILALQRSAGNAAVGGLLIGVSPAPAATIQRAPNMNSMDAAWGEFTAGVPEANVFSFVVRLHKKGMLRDGAGGFTWDDFLAVIASDEGKRWIKLKWRDKEGDAWGDQTIQGQHEWIKTDDVNYVILHVVQYHGGDNLTAWLAACDMLRIPTADVSFNPKISAENVTAANAAPTDFTANTLGQFSGHPGAYHELRSPPHATEPDRYMYRPLTTGEKKVFHTPLHKLLLEHLNKSKNDLPGFMSALQKFQPGVLWGGDIPGLEEENAAQIPNDFYSGQGAGSARRGKYSSTYEEGVGVTTAFQEAQNVADLQSFAREAKARNEQIMEHRVNAVVTQWFDSTVPQSLSNFRTPTVTGPNYTVDPTGRSTEDYDREAGFDAMSLEPVVDNEDVIIPDDVEPDESYAAAPAQQPATAAPPGPLQPMPKKVVDDYGVARSSLTTDIEKRFVQINQQAAQAVEAAVKGAEARQAIQDRFNDAFKTYCTYKQQLDRKLYEEEAKQTTPQALQKLLEVYLAEINKLLDAYVAALSKG